MTSNNQVGAQAINAAPTEKRKRRRYKKEDVIWGLLFGGLPLVGLLIFTMIPAVMAFAMTVLDMPKFFSFDGATFIWFENFATVLKDETFWSSLKNNLILIVSVPVSIVISVICAEVISKGLPGTKVFKLILFIPYVCSVTATTLMWQEIFDANHGVMNQILGLNGFNWLDADHLMWTVVIMTVWSSTGYRILLFTAAITNVNASLKESAQLDGANFIQVFMHITIPAITPTIFYVLVMGTMGSLQEFTRIQIISWTAKDGLCLTGVFYIYREAFQYTNVGVACAASLVLTAIIVLITRLHFYLSKKWVSYEVA